MGRGQLDDYIGQVISAKYRIEQLIGEGGMGRVYRATQLALGKTVVLKILRQRLLADARTVARFHREARAASRLSHPNSISILDFGQANRTLYIAMELVAGRDLHQVLSTDWPLPERRVIHIVTQVLSALADAHSAGIIHRDLKPENIMVEQRRGVPDFVKVLDFGIAKILDARGEDAKELTRTGFVCGTPEYMSPEQAKGGRLDARSDLYAVGILLYQLTTGLLPFEADSPVEFATKHLSAEPPPPSKRRPEAHISVALERLILKALAKNPDDRPQSAEGFRSELIQISMHVSAAANTLINTNPPWMDRERTIRVDPRLLGASAEPGLVSKARPAALKALGVTMLIFSLAATLGFGVYRPLFHREVPVDRRQPTESVEMVRRAETALGAGDVPGKKTPKRRNHSGWETYSSDRGALSRLVDGGDGTFATPQGRSHETDRAVHH